MDDKLQGQQPKQKFKIPLGNEEKQKNCIGNL
jgi:hypothetical protein